MSDASASGVRPVGVAVLGMGTVGSEVIRYMTENADALAARIGRPGSSRAVGLANGSNPIAIVVPCHRVIGADGSLIASH